MQPAHVLLGIENVSFEYPAGNRPLRGVTLEVHAGDLLLLAGPNGSGKTVLLKLMGGFLDPAEGIVRYNGADLRELPERNLDDQILMVRSDGDGKALIGPTVEDELARACRLAGLKGPAIPRRVEDALDAVGMATAKEWYLDEMSSGERRRVALAHAMVSRPRLLLLDDPFVGLDKPGIDLVNGILRDLARRGTAVVFTAHDLSTMHCAERLVLLREGTLALDVPTRVAASEFHLLEQCGLPLPSHIQLCMTLRERGLLQYGQAPLSLEEALALFAKKV